MSDFCFQNFDIDFYWLASQERLNNKWQQKTRRTIKSFFNLPKVTNKCCTLWGLVLAQRLEKG